MGATTSTTEPADINLKDAIGLSDAAQLMRGRRGLPPSPESLRRWIIRGCRCGGRVVRLRGTKMNSEWLTTREWVEEFERVRAQLGMAG